MKYQWRSREGASVGTRPGAQVIYKRFFSRNIFAVIYKRFFSRNIDQSMLKNVYLLEKTVKNRRSVGGSAPEPPLASGG